MRSINTCGMIGKWRRCLPKLWRGTPEDTRQRTPTANARIQRYTRHWSSTKRRSPGTKAIHRLPPFVHSNLTDLRCEGNAIM